MAWKCSTLYRRPTPALHGRKRSPTTTSYRLGCEAMKVLPSSITVRAIEDLVTPALYSENDSSAASTTMRESSTISIDSTDECCNAAEGVMPVASPRKQMRLGSGCSSKGTWA